MADGVCSRSHAGGARAARPCIRARDRTLPHSARRIWGQPGRAFATSIAGPRGRRTLLVQLLLMPQEQVPPRKAPRALGALKRLLLCMGALVSLQMFQPGERTPTRPTDMRPRLVRLGRRERGICGLRLRCRDGCCSGSLPSVGPRRGQLRKLTVAAGHAAGHAAGAVVCGAQGAHQAGFVLRGHGQLPYESRLSFRAAGRQTDAATVAMLPWRSGLALVQANEHETVDKGLLPKKARLSTRHE
jgi:hypothetical protein